MRFGGHKGFPIERTPPAGHGVFDKRFWASVRETDEDLPSACGCYIFALRNGSNVVPWYVGKTERRTFQKECFQATKINYYNDVLVLHNGTPVLLLVPRLTRSGKKFSKPTKSGYRDVDFLETLLIGLAYERNPDLVNMKKTKFLREMVVPGVINSPKGKPTAPITELRKALGL